MKLEEHEAKHLLVEYGVAVPASELVTSADDAESAAVRLGGRVAVKAQVESGGRGKAGGVVLVTSPQDARTAAASMLGSDFGGQRVSRLLVEEQIELAEEHYLAVLLDTSLGRPVLMRSEHGGVEIESMGDMIDRIVVPPGGLDVSGPAAAALAAFHDLDAVLVEINPLAITASGEAIALDAKVELDPAARYRHLELFERLEGQRESEGTERERAAADLDLRLIELGGDIAVLANGAGLTMATMDAIEHAGGSPANFLEIGGDAYTKATPALEIVLSQPGVRSLLVNFCGAFARCDVMAAGVIEAWQALQPDIPVAFSVAGTGRDEARAMIVEALAIEPYDTMGEAVRAAVDAAAMGSA